MTGYQIYLSNGALLENINVKTVDSKAYTSLVLIGQGIPNYGAIIAEDLVWMTEHFAAPTPPVNPLIGQMWYGTGTGTISGPTKGPFVRNISNVWDNILTTTQTSSQLLAPKTTIDFTATGITQIFSGLNYDGLASRKFIPTEIILIPNGAITITSPPSFNVYINTLGDVLGVSTFTIPTPNQAICFSIKGNLVYSTGGAPIFLDVSIAGTGGLCTLDTYIFGQVA